MLLCTASVVASQTACLRSAFRLLMCISKNFRWFEMCVCIFVCTSARSSPFPRLFCHHTISFVCLVWICSKFVIKTLHEHLRAQFCNRMFHDLLLVAVVIFLCFSFFSSFFLLFQLCWNFLFAAPALLISQTETYTQVIIVLRFDMVLWKINNN